MMTWFGGVKIMKANPQPWLAVVLLSVYACASDSNAPTATGGGDVQDQADSGTASPADAGKVRGSIDAGRPGLDAGPSRADDAGQVDAARAIVDAGVDAAETSVPPPPPPPVDSAFTACTQALKKPCSYDEKETACGSIRTESLPLSDGTTSGNVEIASGPYGAYVEWNEGSAFANPVSLLEGTCDVLAGAFGEPASVTQDILNLRGADLSLYTVFRPACMKDGEKYPVITWGNGTCGQTGGYASLLATVASHGFVIFAANSRFTDQGNNEMLRALDFAKAANEDSTSALYHKLDLTKVGAMGHSQGSSATAHAATDPRIKALILWNGGTSGSPAKRFLAVSGDRDIGTPTVASYSSFVDAAAQPGAWLYFHKVLETGGNATGHLTLMEQAERATAFTVAWWQYVLNGDATAKKTFVGTDCGLCNDKANYEYGEHGLQ
ncbi:MAG: hypothetical protein JWN04_4381 [Myxococcaceae bacterium]|nr:hypothetical protein [Myxococcaceae bacterium]